MKKKNLIIIHCQKNFNINDENVSYINIGNGIAKIAN